MIGWLLDLTDDQRRATLEQAAQLSGMRAEVIEKDWWVTLTLKALFNTSYSKYIVFKGGTSLSKCWNLISRFSEDIDISLAPEAFEMKYEETPSKAYVKKLKRNGCEFTSNELKTALEESLLALGVPNGQVIITAAPVPQHFPDTDPQTLYIKYPSLYDPLPYIPDRVKIELSVRSLNTPYTQRNIQSVVNQFFPQPVYGETPFPVAVVEARKTFLEKAFLLHEEFKKPDRGRIRAERMSRHIYDLASMAHTPIELAALSDHLLYEQIITHRKWYTGYTYLDYESLGHSLIEFVLPGDLTELYRKDYETMQEQMIHGDTKTFDELLETIKLLQVRFRLKMDEQMHAVVEEARTHLPQGLKLQADPDRVTITVSGLSDPNKPAGNGNQVKIYQVRFRIKNDEAFFEEVSTQ
jgi:hypothetical protein